VGNGSWHGQTTKNVAQLAVGKGNGGRQISKAAGKKASKDSYNHTDRQPNLKRVKRRRTMEAKERTVP
jgi:hypothetical protein